MELKDNEDKTRARLTGKAKHDFLEYYWENYISKSRFLNLQSETEAFFNSLYPIFQSALVVEWLDSVEIYIHSFPRFYKLIKYKGKSCDIEIESEKYFENRTLANLSAIKKAVKIYNTQP
jgi:hypothetical protein